jgi:hypothetical protein
MVCENQGSSISDAVHVVAGRVLITTGSHDDILQQVSSRRVVAPVVAWELVN